MKVGLSTWSLLGLEVNLAVRTIGDSHFDFIELWGEVPHAYPEWTDRRKLKDSLSTYEMALTMHAPFTDLNPAAAFQPVKGAVEKTLEEFVRFSDYLGAKIVTVHSGSVHNEAMVPQSAKNAIATIQRMAKAADGRLAINIENQSKSASKYHFPLASTLESLEFILAEVEGSGFTLDTGHAHMNGLDPKRLAERAGARLTEVHLSDNSGASDDHLFPGEGNAPLEPLLSGLVNTDVLACLELNPHRYSPERILELSQSFKGRK